MSWTHSEKTEGGFFNLIQYAPDTNNGKGEQTNKQLQKANVTEFRIFWGVTRDLVN